MYFQAVHHRCKWLLLWKIFVDFLVEISLDLGLFADHEDEKLVPLCRWLHVLFVFSKIMNNLKLIRLF